MSLNYIKLGGKQRPIRYSHKALRMLSAEMGAKSFQDLGAKVSEIGIHDVPFLAWVGLKEGARHAGDPFDEKVETVSDWLDDESAGIFQVIMEKFTEDFSGGAEEEKKPTAKSTAK
jgi:hypothetical protein